MSKKDLQPLQIGEITKLFDDVKAESDRGAVLLCASWLDDSLSELLRQRLIDDADAVGKLFDMNQPLGTFSSKIAMAYCLGLIDIDMRKDLDVIRGIRNDFGHVRKAISFSDQSIAARCQNLTTARKLSDASFIVGMQEYSSDRDRLLVSATMIIGYLLTIAAVDDHCKVGSDVGFQMYLEKCVERGAMSMMSKLLDRMEQQQGEDKSS